MITLKKFELQEALLTISAFDPETKKMVSGLLMEDLSLGTKRKLQKIHKKLHEAYTEFVNDVKEIQEKLKDDAVNMEKELKILIEEDVNIDSEFASLANIESISSEKNYNFEIIEKFAA